MKFKPAIYFMIFLLATASCALGEEKPSLVLIVSDDTGWNDIGFNGSKVHTPHIDSLARDGVRLDRFYAFPVCSPTRTGLLTGRNPIRVGITNALKEYQTGLPLDEHILPQTLKAYGYQTFMAGKWHQGGPVAREPAAPMPDYPLPDVAHLPHHRGFDHFYGFVSGSLDPLTHIAGEERVYDWQFDGDVMREQGHTNDLLTARSIRFIRERDKARPFFLYLPYHAMHTPHRPSREYYQRQTQFTDPKRREFAAMVEQMDDNVGRLLKTLDDEGLRENTLVLFISDNGGQYHGGADNMPLNGEKGTVYEGGIRVPAAIRFPERIAPGSESGQVVAVWDLFPTICDALGVAPKHTKPLDGISRWPQLTGKAPVVPPASLVFARRGYAVLDGPWKLLADSDARTTYLFKIDEDPTEQWDYSADYPEQVKRLTTIAETMISQSPNQGLKGPARQKSDRKR